MDWLQKYQAKIDCEVRSIELTGANGATMIYYTDGARAPYAQVPHSPKTMLYFMEGLEDPPPPELHEVDIVCEFPDVFPEELPGMQIGRAHV